MKNVMLIFVGIFLWLASCAQAQVMMEFTWNLENVEYEGLLYVPRDKPATMTVRVLNENRTLKVLLLENVEMLFRENGVVCLQCSSPVILWGPKDFAHKPEVFTAQDDAPGKVSNGKTEALYEINTINSENIGEIVKKYLKPEGP